MNCKNSSEYDDNEGNEIDWEESKENGKTLYSLAKAGSIARNVCMLMTQH